MQYVAHEESRKIVVMHQLELSLLKITMTHYFELNADEKLQNLISPLNNLK